MPAAAAHIQHTYTCCYQDCKWDNIEVLFVSDTHVLNHDMYWLQIKVTPTNNTRKCFKALPRKCFPRKQSELCSPFKNMNQQMVNEWLLCCCVFLCELGAGNWIACVGLIKFSESVIVLYIFMILLFSEYIYCEVWMTFKMLYEKHMHNDRLIKCPLFMVCVLIYSETPNTRLDGLLHISSASTEPEICEACS